MDCLGISINGSQGAAVLLRDNQVVATAVEDRPREDEQGPFLPVKAVEYCLVQGGRRSLSEIDGVGLQASRSLEWSDLVSESVETGRGFFAMLKSLPFNLKDELLYRLEVRRELQSLEGEEASREPLVSFFDDETSLIRGIYHSQSQPNLAILKLDKPLEEGGSGLWSLGPQKREQVWVRDFPHSLDLLLRNLAVFSGFRGRLGEKQFIDLASYGEPRFVELLRGELIELAADGGFRLELNCLNEHPQAAHDWSELSRMIGGDVRNPSAPISSREIDLAHSFVAVIKEFAFRTSKIVKDNAGIDRILVHGQGPICELVRARLQRSRRFAQVQATNDADESLILAAGAALGIRDKLAQDQPSQVQAPDNRVVLNVKPPSHFERFSLRGRGPVPQV